IIFLVTAVLLVLFARGVHLPQVMDQVIDADIPFLIVALIAASSAYVLRAWRWQFLLRPMKKTQFASAFRATAIGFAASFLLPGRTGEVLRPYLLARREGLSAVAAFATVIVERLLDMIGVLLLFAAFLSLADVAGTIKNASMFHTVQTAGLLAGGVSLI